ncbi:MAG: D-xylose ABC transporter ATP-binding protein [Acidobacteria bacterium]|nr:MAG: D-xylose ABC transporter ATP-binding protein [Acidobacteriota bacterium]
MNDDQSDLQPETREFLLEMRNIDKRFPGVHALQGVDLRVRRGEVHALVGENGAGKSTLMKILSGAISADSGDLFIAGKAVMTPTPTKMLKLGVAVIYQELMLAPHLTVTENIYLGRLAGKQTTLINWGALRQKTAELLVNLGFEINPDAKVGQLSVADKQLVEIAKALSTNVRVLVLDEPTAVLHETEVAKLFKVIRSLAKRGVSFVYISHRLAEIYEIADRVTVLRDGRLIRSEQVNSTTSDEIVRWMVGRDCSTVYPKKSRQVGEIALRCEGLSRGRILKEVSLVVRRGEIVGIAGLAGSGRTEVLRAIVGADRLDKGSVSVNGKEVKIKSPKHALELGIALVPEERKTEGLFLQHPVAFNVTLTKVSSILRGGFVDLDREYKTVESFIKRLRIATPSARQKVGNLSGGNQQKCVLASRIHAECDILLVDEPTRGIDVGAKLEIYQLLTGLVEREGLAVLLVSSELPEILGLCDRIYVMRSGTLSGEVATEGAAEEQIMNLAA